MAIWTSRYSNKKLAEDGYYPVGISIGKPKFPLNYEVREWCYSLAPKGYMLNLHFDEYKPAYIEKLEGIGRENIIQTVRRLEARAEAEDKELVLLCFEDVRIDGEFCHRRLFADWWQEVTGEEIKELDDPTPPKEKKPKKEATPKKTDTKEAEPVQLDLFTSGLVQYRNAY